MVRASALSFAPTVVAAASMLLLLSPLCVSAYWILTTPTLVLERLDPIVSPGEVSSHCHTVLGGSNFHAEYDYDNQRASPCTTSPVSVDFSNYWAPTLYYVSPDQSNFTAIPSWTRVYYLQRPGPLNQPIKAFPKGFQMMAGDPNRRTFNPNWFNNTAVTFVCLDYYNDHTGDPEWDERNDFFKHNCPDGMRAQFFFPSCWDGVNLKSEGGSHMSYPIQDSSGGDCPDSHPVHLISLFFEFVFEVNNFPYNENNITWALANGDTTGYGFHADFTNGWDPDFLQTAIDHPTCQLNTGGDPSVCEPFQPYLTSTSSYCKPNYPVLDENVGYTSGAIPALPGCNPLWFGTGPKPTCEVTPPTPGYMNVSEPLPTDWSYIGCYGEGTSGRALSGEFYQLDNMTNSYCASLCASHQMPYAGTEYGTQCFCGWFLGANGANTTELAADECDVDCSGNYLENCGGSSTLTMMYNPTITMTPVQIGWYEVGCAAELTNARLFDGASYANSATMTTNLCISFCAGKNFTYAGTEYGAECYCSNTFDATVLDVNQCTMACAADSSSTCGGSNRLNIYHNGTKPVTVTETRSTTGAAHNNANVGLATIIIGVVAAWIAQRTAFQA